MRAVGAVILAAVTGGDAGMRPRTVIVPDAAAAAPFVEQTIDRGETVEIVIRCPSGTATISYSKARRQFCTRDATCAPSLSQVAARSCG